MEKAEIKPWVDANAQLLIKEYGLPHWKINFDYVQISDLNWDGRCTSMPKYEQAFIEINCPKVDDFKDLEEIVRHELAHVVHSPLHFFEEAVFEALAKLPYSEPLQASLRYSYTVAAELIVKNIERMHSGHVERYKDASTIH